MSQLGFGIVGTGMIAGVIAEALGKSKTARLAAVSSRRVENAQGFAARYPGAVPVQGIDTLLACPDVGAVYLAVPTVAKEEIALAAIAAGKHVLVDKPFASRESVLRMTTAAADKGVLFMDATHFVHHPRTAAIQAAISQQIGSPRSLHTVFYFPFSDRNNIRFDRTQEPMTVVGDMAWYSMRAVVEYLRPAGKITAVVTVPERDPATGAIVRAEGLIAFDSGEVSTFDVGYTAGTIAQDLELLGTTGIVSMDDFVLDWHNSFPFKNPNIATGYSHKTGMATRSEATFVPTPSAVAQEVAMVEAFAGLSASRDAAQRAAYAAATLKTQEYLDAIWGAANS